MKHRRYLSLFQRRALQRTRVAGVLLGALSTAISPGTATAQDGDRKAGIDELEVVIVTAQKRDERLIDVPQAMSVLSADDLTKINAVQFRDFANTIPGLSFTTSGAGNAQISMRGVTAGTDISPTVGIYVDEVPYGSSTAFANSFALDMGLFDLARIEVLRGPQGTLYGASTMGGLLKYVTRQPDTKSFGVDVRTGVSDTHDGGISGNVAATINVPLAAEKAALRATGFYSRDGGYIDNVALGQKNVNRSDIYGGRADLLLTPSEAFSIRITSFLQDIDRDGEGTSDYAFSGVPLDSSLDQRRLFDEPFEKRFRLVSGTATYDLDWASLTSISSYQTVRAEFIGDLSVGYVPLLASIGRTYSAVGYTNENTTDKFTQEVRLASAGTQQGIEWLIGGFYTRETSENTLAFILRDLAGQLAPNDVYTNVRPSRYEEYAAFGDLTWYLTDKLNVTGGIRYAKNRLKGEQIATGIFGVSPPPGRMSEDIETYLANARYHFSDHATGYVRYATGYRPGGPNFVTRDATTGLPMGPGTFESDQLKSYEIGFKARTVNERFGIDVASYYIDWSNIQIALVRGGFALVGNAPGGASVRGAELTLTGRPYSGFTVIGAFAYQDAELSEADSDLGGAKDERLPNVPRFTAALNADYELPLGGFQPTVGATLRYVDDRKSGFNNSTSYPNHSLPDYTTVDLRTALTFDRVNVQLYVHNLFDERGQLSALTPFGTARVAIMQPRTIGMSVTTHY